MKLKGQDVGVGIDLSVIRALVRRAIVDAVPAVAKPADPDLNTFFWSGVDNRPLTYVVDVGASGVKVRRPGKAAAKGLTLVLQPPEIAYHAPVNPDGTIISPHVVLDVTIEFAIQDPLRPWRFEPGTLATVCQFLPIPENLSSLMTLGLHAVETGQLDPFEQLWRALGPGMLLDFDVGGIAARTKLDLTGFPSLMIGGEDLGVLAATAKDINDPLEDASAETKAVLGFYKDLLLLLRTGAAAKPPKPAAVAALAAAEPAAISAQLADIWREALGSTGEWTTAATEITKIRQDLPSLQEVRLAVDRIAAQKAASGELRIWGTLPGLGAKAPPPLSSGIMAMTTPPPTASGPAAKANVAIALSGALLDNALLQLAAASLPIQIKDKKDKAYVIDSLALKVIAGGLWTSFDIREASATFGASVTGFFSFKITSGPDGGLQYVPGFDVWDLDGPVVAEVILFGFLPALAAILIGVFPVLAVFLPVLVTLYTDYALKTDKEEDVKKGVEAGAADLPSALAKMASSGVTLVGLSIAEDEVWLGFEVAAKLSAAISPWPPGGLVAPVLAKFLRYNQDVAMPLSFDMATRQGKVSTVSVADLILFNSVVPSRTVLGLPGFQLALTGTWEVGLAAAQLGEQLVPLLDSVHEGVPLLFVPVVGADVAAALGETLPTAGSLDAASALSWAPHLSVLAVATVVLENDVYQMVEQSDFAAAASGMAPLTSVPFLVLKLGSVVQVTNG